MGSESLSADRASRWSPRPTCHGAEVLGAALDVRVQLQQLHGHRRCHRIGALKLPIDAPVLRSEVVRVLLTASLSTPYQVALPRVTSPFLSPESTGPGPPSPLSFLLSLPTRFVSLLRAACQ